MIPDACSWQRKRWARRALGRRKNRPKARWRIFPIPSGIRLLSVALAVLCGTYVNAHEQKKAVGTEQVAARRIPDVILTDQDGHQIRFLSDVLQKRAALISFIYTSCKTTCPLVGATVAMVAEQIQNDVPDAAIVSISVDPEYDTPARLLAWRQQYGDVPQWTLLTGPKRDIQRLLRSLGAYSASLEDHSDILLVGSSAPGQWTRMSSLAAWDKVTAAVRAAAGAR
jgi:protein SCO1